MQLVALIPKGSKLHNGIARVAGWTRHRWFHLEEVRVGTETTYWSGLYWHPRG